MTKLLHAPFKTLSCSCGVKSMFYSSSCCCLLTSSCASFSTISFSFGRPFSPSSCYTIKKQFHVRSAVFLQVHLVLLSEVLIQRCIILLTHFSSN